MTDYQPLLKRALSGLDNNTLEGRRSVYERARHALVNQLRTVTPALAEADITRERLALEEAIRRVEAEASAATRAPVQAPAAPVAPVAPPQIQPQAPTPSAQTWPGQPPAPPPAVQPEPPQAPMAEPQAPAQQPAAAPHPPAPVQPQPAVPQHQAPVQPQAQPQAPVPQPPPAPRSPMAVPAGSPRVAARSAPMPRARIEPAPSIRPAAPQARAPMPAGMESARRPVVSEPRVPVSGIDLDTAEADPQDLRQPLEPLPPLPRPRPRSVEVARSDRRKAMRAKLVVGGIVVILLVVAAGLGYVHRERILAFLHVGPPVVAEADRPKAVDRVASDPNAAARPAQPLPAGSVTTVAQRAVLYEENPGATPQQQQQLFVGTAVWRTETVTLGPGRPPEIGIRVDIDVPDRRMNVVMTIRRNPDTTLPASHTVEIQFSMPGDAFGGVANMPGIRAKGSEAAQGAPLAGLVVRVTPGFFLIGLSNIAADRDRNISLLRERPWMDIPFVYNNGRRAVIAIEKGTPGERVVNEALAAWGL